MRKGRKKIFVISDARFRALVEKSWDVLILVDNKARILYASPSIVRMFGRDYKEFLGVRGIKFVHPADLAATLRAFAAIAIAPAGSIASLELRIMHKNGGYKWIEAHATNLLHDPELGAIVINFHDITASKELEQQKNDFISIASHELKTPITSLKIYVQVLSQKLSEMSLEKSHEVIHKMSYQVNHLVRLITDLLDATKIQENKLSLQKETFYILQIVNDVVSDIRLHISSHKVFIRSTYKGTIYADKFRISQALINLINNAIKFSPKADRVEVRISATKKYICVRVRDFGVGVAKKNQQKIFERFFQSDNQNNMGGLGLGLYITSHIIKQHGGNLVVRSGKGKGSTFLMQLPRK